MTSVLAQDSASDASDDGSEEEDEEDNESEIFIETAMDVDQGLEETKAEPLPDNQSPPAEIISPKGKCPILVAVMCPSVLQYSILQYNVHFLLRSLLNNCAEVS